MGAVLDVSEAAVLSWPAVATIYPVPLGRYTILTAEVGHPILGASSAGASSVAVTASAVVADGKPGGDLSSAAVPSVPSALVDSSFAPLVVDSNLAPLDP